MYIWVSVKTTRCPLLSSAVWGADHVRQESTLVSHILPHLLPPGKWNIQHGSGLAWPQYLPRYGHCVHKKFLVLPEENSYVLFIFQWSNWFSGSPSCYFWLNIKSIDELDNKFLFQQYPDPSSLILYLRASLYPSLPQNHLWEISVQHYISYLYGQGVDSANAASRPGPLSSLIKFHSIVSWWMELRREALLCLVGFILLPFWAGLNCDQSQQNYDSIKTIS